MGTAVPTLKRPDPKEFLHFEHFTYADFSERYLEGLK